MLINDGTGVFSTILTKNLSLSAVASVGAADMIGDPFPDVLVSHLLSFGLNLNIVSGGAPSSVTVDFGPSDIQTGDLNHDGDPDFIAGCSYGGYTVVQIFGGVIISYYWTLTMIAGFGDGSGRHRPRRQHGSVGGRPSY